MTSINRTAYPQLTQDPTPQELDDNYTPTDDELTFVNRPGRRDASRLSILVLIKTFQCLGYFPPMEAIPKRIINHLRTFINDPEAEFISVSTASRYRYHAAIRQYLKIRRYGDGGDDVASHVVLQATQTMNDPADLINAAIEELVHEHYELPAFSTLDHLVQRLRTQVNNDWCDKIWQRLSPTDIQRLQNLHNLRDEQSRTDFVTLKETPGRPRLSEMRRLILRSKWLNNLLDTKKVLVDIPTARIQLFASEARSLETTDIRDITPAKRLTLLICLLHQAKIQTLDHLIMMFIRRIERIHQRAKETLDDIREQQRETTEYLIHVLSQVVHHAGQTDNPTELGIQTQTVLHEHGGIEYLQQQCQAVMVYHNDNILPLLWPSYRRYRKVILDVLSLLIYTHPLKIPLHYKHFAS